jgi:hypothetical protein
LNTLSAPSRLTTSSSGASDDIHRNQVVRGIHH